MVFGALVEARVRVGSDEEDGASAEEGVDCEWEGLM